MSPAQLLQALDTPPPAYRLHSSVAILGRGTLVLVSESQTCIQQDTGLDGVGAHGWVELGTARLQFLSLHWELGACPVELSGAVHAAVVSPSVLRARQASKEERDGGALMTHHPQ